MAVLEWDIAGARYYETGIDRGVLYVSDYPGVPWNGLKGVEDTPTDGGTQAYYQDGIRYLNVSGRAEYSGSLEAFTYPDEFEECDGTAEIAGGFFATLQPRQSFGLTYRTKIGNDTDGINHGYRIHIIYNVMAEPSSKNYTTLDTDPEPIAFNWALSAVPVFVGGFRPTPHLILDSRRIPSMALKTIEDILYGTPATQSRLPLPSEIKTIIETVNEFTVLDNGNGTYLVWGDEVTTNGITFTVNHENVEDNGDGTFEISS